MEQTVQKWIDNGVLSGQEANKAQARMAARIIYDGGDGFGTDCKKIKKAVRMIKCPRPIGNKAYDNAQAKEVYRLVNDMINKHNTFYGLGSPCTDLIDYCEGEMWDHEVKYLKGILAETNAIQGKEKAQAIHDLTEEAVAGGGTDIEYLTQAIKGINSREDRIAVEAILKEYCQKHNVKLQYEGQSYLQAILYDECDKFMGFARNHKEIRKFNEMLIAQGAYNEKEIINIRAEQAALQIMEGDFSNTKEAVQQIKDPKVYARVIELIKEMWGGGHLNNYLTQELGLEKADLVNAELAANNIIGGEEAANIAYRLILNSDFDVRAKGVMAIRTSEVAKLVDQKLKANGSSLAEVLNKFNKEKAEYRAKADIWNGLGSFGLGFIGEAISDEYKKNTDASDNMYVEVSTPQNLSETQKNAYEMTVKIFEEKLEKMKKAYQEALDSQGVVSGAINAFCETYGLGTTREEIESRIEHDTETLRLLKLAAKGKLAKVENGKNVAVSFEAVFKERNVDTNFDVAKVEKIAKQAETMIAMGYGKENIAICWEELSNARTAEQYAIAIIDTLEKISTMTGKQLSLAGFNYSYKDGTIVDASGNTVPLSTLQEIAQQLKQGLSDISQDLLGTAIPMNTTASNISDVLSEGYDKKLESFKQEFKAAFGQDVPDEMLEDYMSTINTGMTVLNFGVMIGAMVAAPFTGGGSLAVFAMTAAGSLGLNALEHSTDADGWTNSEWTSDVSQAMWDGALSAVGFKIGQFAESFARGSQLVVNQNKWLAKLPKNKIGEALNKAKYAANKMQAYSGKIGKSVLETRKAQILAKNPGANLNSVEKASLLFARAEACGFEITSDMAQSLVQSYCMTGQFDEESFLTALCISLGANLIGHSFAARNMDQAPVPNAKGEELPATNPKGDDAPVSAPKDEKTPAPVDKTGTEVLDKASSHGTANPSVVNVGAKKADAIKTEVESALNNPEISGEELARIRQEVEALSDRDLRRKLLEKIDNKAKALEAPKQEVFNEARAENLENNVNHIFEKHSELNATDVRVLNEYISGIEDVNVLNELKDKLSQKELTYGGVTKNYDILRKSIDDRINSIKPKTITTNSELRDEVSSMLTEKAKTGKGLNEDDVNKIKEYIETITDETQLKDLQTLLNGKKMTGAHKKQLKTAIENKRNSIQQSGVKVEETPEVDEAPRSGETPKTGESPEVDEAPRSDNTPKNDGIQDDINASGNYKKDVNGHILPEEYKNMSNDELIEEYTRLKEYELDGTVRQVRELSYELDGTIRLVRELSINSHDASAQKSAIRQELENRGLKLTRSYDGNKTVYGYDNAEKAPDSNKTHESENANKTPGSDKPDGEKSFETMNPDELFAEYYRLKMEVTYSPLSTADKAANINKMKEIEKLINEKGYNEAPKSESSADKSEAPKSNYTAAELRQKLGEKLYKAYQKADDFIAKLRNIDDYKKVKNYIQANFHKYVDIMDHLLDKLEAAAKKIGLKIKKTVLGETTSKYFRSKDVADFVNAQYVDPHTLYQDLLNKGFEQTRATYFSKDQAFISMYDPKGKTLYTYIYEGTECVHKSKCYATRNADGSLTRHSELTVDYQKDGKAKVNIKEGNADIYTETVNVKNPSQHIDPKKAEAISKFDHNAPIVDLPMSGDMLNLNAQYALDIDNLPELTLINGTKVDLDSPEFRNKIASLKDGEFLTIGREGDIKLYVSYNSGVSRHHILITRQNGQIVMKDISKFGKTLCSTKIAQGYAYGFDISSGRISANDYTYRNIDDLKNQMRDVLDRFSTNSQNVIINDLMQKNSCRLQKHGIEYQFSMRGNTVHLEEFDITTKYNITESIIDNYSKQTTYDINDVNDIFWAINDKLSKFSPETQSYIINKLAEGNVCRLRKGGISYEFTLDANGRITIKEYDYARYNYDNSQRSEDFNNNRNNRANNAGNNEAERMSKIEKQERIQTLESLIERADDISKFKTKFANLFSPDFKVSTEADVQELKKTTRLIKAFWHTDAGSGAPTELQMTIDELFNMTDGKYVSNGAARMGTPAEVNSMLEKLRQLTDINALEKELAELKG